MAQNTNLNVTPYYDDFDKSKNFYRVLFRPGFPIQARELTTMQSVLQNQVENVGSHIFKDGAMVIPGQVGYDLNVDAIMIQESFLGADVELYRTQLEGKIIEGLTTGVKAKVLFSISDTNSDKGYITVYLKYIESGGDNAQTQTFENNEQLITDTEVTFGTTLIEIGSPFAQLLPTDAIQTGSAAYVQEGVYYIRGFFVDVPYQYILLDQYGSNPSYRIGLDIQESIITPEDDLSLNDNAAGTSNYSAPGSHRFRITTRLVKKSIEDDADKDFIELLRIKNSRVEKLVDRSQYEELERSLATRTYEESGDYVVDDFDINLREHLDDGENNGIYDKGNTSADGAIASENLYAVEFGPGTGYVKGYRIKTLAPTYVDLVKPRDTDSTQNKIVPFYLGNFSKYNNVYGYPYTTGQNLTTAYQVVELYDRPSGSGVGAIPASGILLGYARVGDASYIDDIDNVYNDANDEYRFTLFDIQLKTVLEMEDSSAVVQGSILIGENSNARAQVLDDQTSDHLDLYHVQGSFVEGENILLDGEVLSKLQKVHYFEYSDVRQITGRNESNAVEFTADLIMENIVNVIGTSFKYKTVDSVLTISNLSAGIGYVVGENISCQGGTGFGLSVNITVVDNGVIISDGQAAGATDGLNLTTGGSGYATGTGTATTGGDGTGATVDIATIINGVAATSSIASAGTGYAITTGATTSGGGGTGCTVNITGIGSGGELTGVVINEGGSGFAAAETLTVTGGGGTSGTFTVDSVTDGVITAINLNARGTGYTVGNVLSISTGGANATATVAEVDNGIINTIVVDNPGRDYSTSDTGIQINGQSGYTTLATLDVATINTSDYEVSGLQSNFRIDLRSGDRLYFNEDNYVDIKKVSDDNLSGTGQDRIFDYLEQRVLVDSDSNAPSPGSFTNMLRYRSGLKELENADFLSQMPKNYIKSIADESLIVKRTFNNVTITAGDGTINVPENEQFAALSDISYQITVLDSTNAAEIGDQIELNTTGSGSNQVAFTNAEQTNIEFSSFGTITKLRVTTTVSKNVGTRKTKTGNQMFVLKVNKTIRNSYELSQYGLNGSRLYGTRIEDLEISLGMKDCYRLHAVYESENDNAPVLPSVTLVESKFFATGSIVTGKTSKARAKVVFFDTSTLKLSLVYEDGAFLAGETIEGVDTNDTDLVGIISDSDGAVVKGSKNITENYFLEVNQTNFIYDISKIVRRKGVVAPIRQVLIVCDYYVHSPTGDYFGGQSYLDTDYADIPFYETAFLADYLDFRPGVKNLFSGAGTVNSPAFVNCSTLDFKSRLFTSGGGVNATIFDIPQISSNFRCDFDWYLPRTDKAFLTPDGEFQIIKGKSSETPSEPDDLIEGMLLAVINHRPYGFDVEDAAIVRSDNRRYTMRDIGGLERRLDQVEYYTSLNLLESDTVNEQILDADGKDRLKNGFVVDDFTDHSKSAIDNEDFGASLDFTDGTMRCSHYTTNVNLEINDSLSSNIQITGAGTELDDANDIVTLPYTEVVMVEQPYASRVENINPFNVFTYIARIILHPGSDDWVDTRRLPARVTQIEGDFEETASELRVDQNGFAPIQWRAWRTTWRGERTVSSRTTRNRGWLAQDIGRSPRPRVWGGRGMRRINRTSTIQSTRTQVRRGVRTRVVPRIDRTSMGDSVVSATAIRWMRSRNVRIWAERLKPRTRFYIFFDGKDITDYVTPKLIELIKDPAIDSRTNDIVFNPGELVRGLTSGCQFVCLRPNGWYQFSPYDDTELPTTYAATTNLLNHNVYALAMRNGRNSRYFGNMQVGEVLRGAGGARAVVKDRRHISDRNGKYRGNFFIPEPRNRNNPRWRTGTRTLRMSTSDTDSRVPGIATSSGEVEFEATGTRRRVRENVLAVRNADIVRDTVTQRRTIRSTRTEVRQVGWYDPLAQSFITDIDGGVFMTGVEVYFNTKDDNIPVSMQVRTMENGYPTTNILPFSDVTLEPSAIQLSETAAIPTKFTFRSPVYIPQSQEHCFVLLSDSNSYQVWISRMGEQEISGDRTISEQPYAGVLFKSQNASTWTADQYEDLKFKMYRAEFDITQNSRLVINNSTLGRGNDGIINLRRNAIQTFTPRLKLTTNTPSSGPPAQVLSFSVGSRIRQRGSITGTSFTGEGTVTAVKQLVGGAFELTIENKSNTFSIGSSTGSGINGRIISSGTLSTITGVTITQGTAFVAGEIIKGATSNAIAEVIGFSSGTLTLKYVSQVFTAGETLQNSSNTTQGTFTGVAYSGDNVVNGVISDVFLQGTVSYGSSERIVKIFHSNHCMHSTANNVIIEGAISEVTNTYLTAAISATDTTIQVNDASAFHRIIGGTDVAADNTGFIKIGDEIISYNGFDNNFKTINVEARGADGTTAEAHEDESIVECYNLDGIPLTQINKTHLSISNPTLDTYELSTNAIGSQGITGGGDLIYASQNVQYEVMVPQIERMLLPGTDVVARANVISGTSIGDGESLTTASFSNDGVFTDLVLSEDNALFEPALICSEINETNELSGGSSLRIDMELSSNKSTISPVIDMDRMSMTTVSHRINTPQNPNSALLSTGDDHNAVYITRPAELVNPSGSLKIKFQAWRPLDTVIKVLYRVKPIGSLTSINELGYTYFLDAQASIPAATEGEIYRDYEYEISGLNFDTYQVKIIMTSNNQASVPLLKDFRAISLAV